MFDILKHAHSGIRWILLALLLYAIYNAYTGWRGGRKFLDKDRKANLFAMIAAHVQLLIGLALWAMAGRFRINGDVMKDAMLRFFAVEHFTLMLIAIILITVGYSRSKKGTEDAKRFKVAFWCFTIALVLILVAIPWPPRFGAGWF